MSKNTEANAKEKSVPMDFSPKHILVPVDGSQNSKRALETALKIAQTYESTLNIVSVVPFRRMAVESTLGVGASPSYYQYVEEDSKKTVDEAVIFARDKNGYPNVEGEIVRGSESIVKAIVEYADHVNADLIVIGTRGLGGFKKMLLGSVSNGVVTHANCQVLVVR